MAAREAQRRCLGFRQGTLRASHTARRQATLHGGKGGSELECLATLLRRRVVHSNNSSNKVAHSSNREGLRATTADRGTKTDGGDAYQGRQAQLAHWAGKERNA